MIFSNPGMDQLRWKWYSNKKRMRKNKLYIKAYLWISDGRTPSQRREGTVKLLTS